MRFTFLQSPCDGPFSFPYFHVVPSALGEFDGAIRWNFGEDDHRQH